MSKLDKEGKVWVTLEEDAPLDGAYVYLEDDFMNIMPLSGYEALELLKWLQERREKLEARAREEGAGKEKESD